MGKTNIKASQRLTENYSVPDPGLRLRTQQSGTTVFQGANGDGDSASVAQ